MYMIVEKERIYQTVFSDSWCHKEIVSLLSDPISFEWDKLSKSFLNFLSTDTSSVACFYKKATTTHKKQQKVATRNIL